MFKLLSKAQIHVSKLPFCPKPNFTFQNSSVISSIHVSKLFCPKLKFTICGKLNTHFKICRKFTFTFQSSSDIRSNIHFQNFCPKLKFTFQKYVVSSTSHFRTALSSNLLLKALLSSAQIYILKTSVLSSSSRFKNMW